MTDGCRHCVLAKELTEIGRDRGKKKSWEMTTAPADGCV